MQFIISNVFFVIVLHTLGFVFSQLGQLKGAEESFIGAVETFQIALQENDNNTAISEYRLL